MVFKSANAQTYVVVCGTVAAPVELLKVEVSPGRVLVYSGLDTGQHRRERRISMSPSN